jgi:hypothetical protein
VKLTIFGADLIEFYPSVLLDTGPEYAELSGESFNLLVRLDNVHGYATEKLNPPPLRARCLLEFENQQVAGIVQSVTLAEETLIRIET